MPTYWKLNQVQKRFVFGVHMGYGKHRRGAEGKWIHVCKIMATVFQGGAKTKSAPQEDSPGGRGCCGFGGSPAQ